MQVAKKCPKCGYPLERGKLVSYGIITLEKKDGLTEKVVPFYCRNCGYIELYNEKYVR